MPWDRQVSCNCIGLIWAVVRVAPTDPVYRSSRRLLKCLLRRAPTVSLRKQPFKIVYRPLEPDVKIDNRLPT